MTGNADGSKAQEPSENWPSANEKLSVLLLSISPAPHSRHYRVDPGQREVQTLETAGKKGKSRGQSQMSRRKQDSRAAHFCTVRSGGFDEVQIICYLWDLVKCLEPLESTEREPDRNASRKRGVWKIQELEKQLRGRVRVEMRRYFLRKKRRNRKLLVSLATSLALMIGLFGFLIGVDQVSGSSMYPYLNDGDWIVYSRIGGELRRGEVVVFEKNGEGMVKRITGLPGDRVEISDSGYRVVINGVQMRESYVALTNPASGEKEIRYADQMSVPLTVMDNQYLVLGDNRSVSIDSRDSDIGTVSAGNIMGRVVLVLRIGG